MKNPRLLEETLLGEIRSGYSTVTDGLSRCRLLVFRYIVTLFTTYRAIFFSQYSQASWGFFFEDAASSLLHNYGFQKTSPSHFSVSMTTTHLLGAVLVSTTLTDFEQRPHLQATCVLGARTLSSPLCFSEGKSSMSKRGPMERCPPSNNVHGLDSVRG